MPQSFYQSTFYKEKQGAKTKENWQKGIFDFLYKYEKRVCVRGECKKIFETIPSDKKIYCSRSCAAHVNNIQRGPQSTKTKLKIACSLKGRRNPFKGIQKKPRIKTTCQNPHCGKVFLSIAYASRKFCSVDCSIHVIGGQVTSPRAARGKAGIREDIDPTIYFYSRWEANMARLFTLLNIEWTYQPKTFDLKTQNYTPDFYLPNHDTYIEVKNFLWKYSAMRDKKFRALYPQINLVLILKKDYQDIAQTYAHLIKNWEYSNSPFPLNN